MSLLWLFVDDWRSVSLQAAVWFVVIAFAVYVWITKFKKKIPWGLLQTLGLLLFAAFLLALIPNLKFGANDGTGPGDTSKQGPDKPGVPLSTGAPRTEGPLTITSTKTLNGRNIVLEGPGGEKNKFSIPSEYDKLEEKIAEYAKRGVNIATIVSQGNAGDGTLDRILRDAGIKKVNTK